MKSLIFLLALCLILPAVPAAAQFFYTNGPPNGNTDAWTINFGFVVSDRFSTRNGGTVTGAAFAMWTFPGDTLTSAELCITSLPDGGTSYFDQTVNFTQSACTGNQYGYNVCQESTTFSGPTLSAGTYWINLQNASVPNGDPIYWDENSGGTHAWPPGAQENSVGTIPAEAFTLFSTCAGGSRDCLASSTTPEQSTVPEPGSLSLLGWGGVTALAFLGALRRKLF